MGRHKDVFCEKCGFPYQIGASDEVDSRTNQLTGVNVIAGTCPNCRYTMYIGPENEQGKSYPSYKGDRILVGKFAYDFSEPKRWDVAVFKWPGGAETNYIKRLVGLPGETLKISHGDIFIRTADQKDFDIARKPPEKLEAVLQSVYDNDYTVPELTKQGWPLRWGPPPDQTESAGRWQASEDARSFHTDGSAKDDVWLRYQHVVPSFQDWSYLRTGGTFTPKTVQPQLITDFAAYNTDADDNSSYRGPMPQRLGLHWVGDLAVEGVLEVESPSGEALIELVEGGWRFRCRIDVATGVARLSIDGLDEFQATAQTDVRGPGKYHFRFANVDDQLLLWINKSVVQFDHETTYPHLDNTVPTAADLEPVRIGSRGAALRISHLKVLRDLYYIAVGSPAFSGEMSDFSPSTTPYRPLTPQRVAQFLSDPREWRAFDTLREVEFTLEKDQYFMLGDNSAESSDSRLWGVDGFEPYVRRELLIGKALYVYWPHSWDRIPGTNIWFPLFPNFARMEFVR
jgi:signal peptidase I